MYISVKNNQMHSSTAKKSALPKSKSRKRKAEKRKIYGKVLKNYKIFEFYFVYNVFSTTDNSIRFSEMDLASHLEYFK